MFVGGFQSDTHIFGLRLRKWGMSYHLRLVTEVRSQPSESVKKIRPQVPEKGMAIWNEPFLTIHLVILSIAGPVH